MIKKLSNAVAMFLLLALLLSACGAQAPSTTTVQRDTMPENPNWVCPPSLMIDGQMWRDWSLEPLVDPNLIAEEQILGYITSTVSLTNMPTQNNEANYPAALHAPYARWMDEEYGQVYIIKYGYGWHILLPEDYPIS